MTRLEVDTTAWGMWHAAGELLREPVPALAMNREYLIETRETLDALIERAERFAPQQRELWI